MIDDDLLDIYFVAARIPADQWGAQRNVIRTAFEGGTGYLRDHCFVAWFETDAAGADDLRAGRIPTVTKGGPIFYGWAMLSDGSDRMLYRRLARASGCKYVVFERWQKGLAGVAALSLVERELR